MRITKMPKMLKIKINTQTINQRIQVQNRQNGKRIIEENKIRQCSFKKKYRKRKN